MFNPYHSCLIVHYICKIAPNLVLSYRNWKLLSCLFCHPSGIQLSSQLSLGSQEVPASCDPIWLSYLKTMRHEWYVAFHHCNQSVIWPALVMGLSKADFPASTGGGTAIRTAAGDTRRCGKLQSRWLVLLHEPLIDRFGGFSSSGGVVSLLPCASLLAETFWCLW